MTTYILGKCPGCMRTVSAMADIGSGDAMRESILEDLDAGYIVSAIRSSANDVMLESCQCGAGKQNRLTLADRGGFKNDEPNR